MKIGLFTANQPRHFALIRRLAKIADEVIVAQECSTLFPGQVGDFYRKSETMERYFALVREAECTVFGAISILDANVRSLALREGDINRLPLKLFSEFFSADAIIVYGSSYLKGELCAALIKRRAINIHMGVSPYYRGSSCNFWAMYDRRPELVGATIHLLSTGLDSGQILFHAFPKPSALNPFTYGMMSVKAAHIALSSAFADGSLFGMTAVPQDRSKEIRYARTSEFTDEVATEYLEHMMSPTELLARCSCRDEAMFVRPRLVPTEDPNTRP
jgi:hypothetical protein